MRKQILVFDRFIHVPVYSKTVMNDICRLRVRRTSNFSLLRRSHKVCATIGLYVFGANGSLLKNLEHLTHEILKDGHNFRSAESCELRTTKYCPKCFSILFCVRRLDIHLGGQI